jgi:hypothetical protein
MAIRIDKISLELGRVGSLAITPVDPRGNSILSLAHHLEYRFTIVQPLDPCSFWIRVRQYLLHFKTSGTKLHPGP